MAPRKKQKPLDDEIKNIVKKEVKTMLGDSNNGFEDNEELDSFDLDPDDRTLKELSDEKDHQIINKILQSFPSSEGFYGKLYRKTVNGKYEFKQTMDFLEEISDPELAIYDLIKENGWPDGDYALRVFKKGDPDCKKTILWKMAISTSKKSNGNEMKQDETVEKKLAEIGTFMKMVKDITHNSDSISKPEDTIKLLADAFKSGLSVSKESSPSENTEDKMTKTIALFKSLGLIKDKDTEDSENSMMKMLTAMKELGIFAQEKKPDIWQEIIKLKELGFIKIAGEDKEDSLSQIEKISRLIEAVRPLTGEGSGEKPSLGVEIIRVLGPQIPQIVENITETINKVADVSKAKLIRRTGMEIPSNLLTNKPAEKSNIEANPYNTTEEIQVPENQEVKTEPIEMNPIIKEIYDAVEQNVKEYFPKLQELIILYIGKPALESVANNDVSIDTFLGSISQNLKQPFFLEEKTKKYFVEFIAWYIEQTTKDIVIAKCQACSEEFDFENEEAWEKDLKICDCGGKLERIELHIGGNA